MQVYTYIHRNTVIEMRTNASANASAQRTYDKNTVIEMRTNAVRQTVLPNKQPYYSRKKIK